VRRTSVMLVLLVLAIVQWLAVIVIFFVAPHPHWSTIVSSTVVVVGVLTLYLRARRSREPG
jgi:hypothetical protein